MATGGKREIVLKNGKAGRLVASGLRQHDQTMHGGKTQKIVVKNGGNGKTNGNGRAGTRS